MTIATQPSLRRFVTLTGLSEEPFRLFFPWAVVWGLVGVSLWPLHFSGWVTWYPGANHGRLMASGFFGGFVIGFLGTAMPRMVGAPRLAGLEVGCLFALYTAMNLADALAYTAVGDGLFLLLLAMLTASLVWRVRKRTDLPPPGFVLVGLAFLSAAAGTLLALLQNRLEGYYFWLALRPLLQFHGFILLPILGVGGFILPRFFGLPSRHDFPESRLPPPGWTREVIIALGVAATIGFSFVWEAAGHPRTGSAARFLVSAAYLFWHVPFFCSKVRGSSLALVLRFALLLLPAGFLATALFPAHRLALLHLTLIGGFSLLTICVATRVVFAHSGRQSVLPGRLPWLTIAVMLMLLGMVTRISGDYVPKILSTHYSYGALLWAVGVVLWSVKVFPWIFRPSSG
ncbi:MAG TPA: NnrS family protein [Verrucomicrobiae bacterium]